jgi:hypothetical protein
MTTSLVPPKRSGRLATIRRRLSRWCVALYDRVRSKARSMWDAVAQSADDLSKRKWIPETSALGPANWRAGIICTAIVASLRMGMPNWCTGALLAIAAYDAVNYWCLYWHFAKNDKDQLRPASHVLDKYLADLGVKNRSQRAQRTTADRKLVSEAKK